MPHFEIPVTWECWGTVSIEADSLDDAIAKTLDDAPLPEANYVDNSLVIDEDHLERNQNTYVAECKYYYMLSSGLEGIYSLSLQDTFTITDNDIDSIHQQVDDYLNDHMPSKDIEAVSIDVYIYDINDDSFESKTSRTIRYDREE